MRSCPYCDFALDGALPREQKRQQPAPGRKTTGTELVHCPECERVIDGFSSH